MMRAEDGKLHSQLEWPYEWLYIIYGLDRTHGPDQRTGPQYKLRT